ncbi:MAG: hypothetical protein NTX01_05025 [Candidatus Omnitrophica bacterium]|nr:hypothetical protein [Candidatus Omnitrophota bacterium]
MPNRDKRGIILFIVIGVIMVVVILATVVLRIISNQSRLTHHQVSRIQAQYAAKAGVLYALDKMRRNDDAACWPSTGSYTGCMSSSPATCFASMPAVLPACVVIEPALAATDPYHSPVSYVAITVDAIGTGPSNTRKVSATANYTYTP